MKQLIIIVACAALWSCTHTWKINTGNNDDRSSFDAESGPWKSRNDFQRSVNPSFYEDCMMENEGAKDAELICNAYVKAGQPNTDPNCDNCVDGPCLGCVGW